MLRVLKKTAGLIWLIHHWGSQIYRHYGYEPYWEETTGAIAANPIRIPHDNDNGRAQAEP